VQDPPESDIVGRIVKRAQEGAAEGGEAALPPAGVEPNRITLYQDGFQVNGGEFRAASDPANRQFLATLAAGFVPEELSSGGGTHHVALEDKRTEKYVPPPPPAYIAFGGDAMSLGASTPSEMVFLPSELSREVIIDASAPSTVIQVKLIDGKKIKVKVAQTNTVADLASLIIRDGNVLVPFSMSSGFPPKEITENNATIKDAGLVGASIMLKAA
jgi:UBX domain-containing protein 1